MVFPILGGNSAVGGYAIDNSLRFNDNDSAYLSRTPSSAGNRRTFTLSVWFKLTVNPAGDSNYERQILSADDGTGGNNNFDYIAINNTNKIFIFGYEGAVNQQLTSTQVLRDTSAWYHLVVAFDTTQVTASNRIKVYLNGNQITAFDTASYPSLNFQTRFNNTNPQYIGKYPDSSTQYFDGYMAEYHFIDGQALSPTDFGEFDEDSGIWKPIEYTGTYGTNGFYLDFENSGSLGADQSGNGNNFTPTNLASTDQTTDTPTNNFCTLNPLTPVVTHTLSEANLKSTNSSGTHGGANSTINYPTSGKWYHEVRINAEDSSKGQGVAIGSNVYRTVTQWGNYNFIVGYMSDGTKHIDTGYSTYGTAHNVGDIIGVAYNADDQELTFYHNNTSQGIITTSEMDGQLDFNNLCPVVFGRNIGQTFNFGQDSSFAGATTRQNNTDGNGEGDFYYTPPSGYLTLNTSNLATVLSPTIDDGSQYFNTKLYSGNNTTNPITGVGFAPDFTWLKARNYANAHFLLDTTRGSGQVLFSSSTTTETDFQGTRWQSFDSDGFTLTGSDSSTNISGGNYVTWNWKANGGTTSSNTDGSITSTVQANTTAGFSIVTYTGTGANATVGHGLGKALDMIIVKNRDRVESWRVGMTAIGFTKQLLLNAVDAASTDSLVWQDTAPTSSVFSIGTRNAVNASGEDLVAYCFADVEGYSKFGSYTGNGSNDGTFVYTGFRPSFIMYKNTSRSTAGAIWWMWDTTRDTRNPTDLYLRANDSLAEGSFDSLDILSNGFKLRTSDGGQNASGETIIYMAFAENPFVTSTGIPVTAR